METNHLKQFSNKVNHGKYRETILFSKATFKLPFVRQHMQIISFQQARSYRSSSSQMFFKIGVLKNFRTFHRKILVLESLFNKASSLQVYNFIKKRLQNRCAPVKFAKFLRTPFLQSTSLAASEARSLEDKFGRL